MTNLNFVKGSAVHVPRASMVEYLKAAAVLKGDHFEDNPNLNPISCADAHFL